jgi:hypothetical protein
MAVVGVHMQNQVQQQGLRPAVLLMQMCLLPVLIQMRLFSLGLTTAQTPHQQRHLKVLQPKVEPVVVRVDKAALMYILLQVITEVLAVLQLILLDEKAAAAAQQQDR